MWHKKRAERAWGGTDGEGKMRIETKTTDACRKLQFSILSFTRSRVLLFDFFLYPAPPALSLTFFFLLFLFCGRSNENPIKAPVVGGGVARGGTGRDQDSGLRTHSD